MGFSFDNVHSKDMGIAARMTIENRIPEIRNNTLRMAGRDGLLDLGSSLSERVIEISCFIPPKRSQVDLLDCKDKIVEWLSPDKGLCPLILDTEPERVYFARLQDGVTFEKVVRLSVTFNLVFFCPDPFGYAKNDEIFTLNETGAHTVKRSLGNMYSNPIYRLKGNISSGTGTIAISTNDTELRIANATLSDNEVLVVDTDKMTAWVENAEGDVLRNALPYIAELNFPKLDVGNNTIEISADGAEFTELKIIARSRWR